MCGYKLSINWHNFTEI